jgi:HK97 family phage portal protein
MSIPTPHDIIENVKHFNERFQRAWRLANSDVSLDMFQKSMDRLMSSQYTSMSNRGVSASITFQTVAAAYKSWVYIAANKIATSVAALPIQLYVYRSQRTGKIVNGKEFKRSIKAKTDNDPSEIKRYLKAIKVERELITDHPFLDLIQKPNSLNTRFTLWQTIMLKLELNGAVGLYMPRGIMNIPAQLWPLPLTSTGNLKPIPDPMEVIKGFVYEDGQLKQYFEREEIAWICYPHPGTPYEGMSALKAQTYPYDIDNYIQQMQYYMFKNRAVPGLVLSSDQRLSQNVVDELVDEINQQWGGATNSGKPMILHSGLKEAGRLTPAFEDLALNEINQSTQDKILSAYGTPAGKVGLVKDVNRANMEALDKTFITETLKPRLMIIEEVLERDLLPLYDDRLTLDFELPDTSDREHRLKERKQNIETAYSTINEERESEGRDPVPWGDKPWIPVAKVQPGEEDEEKPDDKAHTPFTQVKSSSPISKASGTEIGFTFEITDELIEWVGIRLDAFSKQVTGTTFDDIKAILQTGFSEGMPVTKIAETLREKFKSYETYRAALIARTEVVGTHNWADLQAVEQSGVGTKLEKFWISSRDGNVRDTHVQAEKEYIDGIGIKRLFKVGTDSMEAPGMGSVAEENINCRCTIGYKKAKKDSYWNEQTKTAYWKMFTKSIDGYEKLFSKAVVKIFKSQLKEVLGKLEGVEGKRFRGEINGWSLGKVKKYIKAKDATARFNIDKKEAIKVTKDATEAIYMQVMEEAGQDRMEQLSSIV